MILRSLVRVFLWLGICAALAGCAIGQTVSYSSQPVGLQGVSSAGTVAVGVQDVRGYVISGNKPEKFVGLMRGGFGNPFDVNTGSGGPLAGEMRDALIASLKQKGIAASGVTLSPRDTSGHAKDVLAQTNARRRLLLTLREWKSDSMLNTSLHYDVQLEVMDEKGATLATNSVRGTDELGAVGLSPAPGIMATFSKKVDTLFDDERVRNALK